MTYNPNIPQPGDFLSNSQVEIKTNFTQLDSIFGIDHYAYSADALNGQHQQVTFPEAYSVDPAFPSGEAGILYTKANAGIAGLWFANSTGTVELGSGGGGGGGGTGSLTPNGYFNFAGGLKIKWGSGGATSGTTGAVTFGSLGGNFTTVFTAYATPISQGVQRLAVKSLSVSGLQVQLENSAATFFWLAMGT